MKKIRKTVKKTLGITTLMVVILSSVGGIGFYLYQAQFSAEILNPDDQTAEPELPDDVKYVSFSLFTTMGISTIAWSNSEVSIGINKTLTEIVEYNKTGRTLKVNLAIKMSVSVDRADEHPGVRVYKSAANKIKILLVGISCGYEKTMSVYIPNVDNGVLLGGNFQNSVTFVSVTTSQSTEVIGRTSTVIVPMEISW